MTLYDDDNFHLRVNSYGCNSVDEYLEYSRIVGDDDGGKPFTPSQYEAYKKRVIPLRIKNRLYVCWASRTSGIECKQVGPETKCFCEHRYKQHKTDFSELPSTCPFKIPCNVSGCDCKTYLYIPTNGTQLLRCKCKHTTNEHSSLGKRRCKKVGCACEAYCTTYRCGCGETADNHKMIIETKIERQLRGMPIGHDVPYKAMGGITGFSSLADGYTRLDQSGIGASSKEFLDQSRGALPYTTSQLLRQMKIRVCLKMAPVLDLCRFHVKRSATIKCNITLSVTKMENRELAENAYKSRKRVSGITNSEKYKHTKIKKAKIAGEAHKNHKGNDVPPRDIGASCRCNSKCMELISEDAMKSTIQFVNKFDSKNALDTYLQSLIEKKDIQRKRPRSEEPKKKEFTFIYHSKINGVRKKVCKKAFCSMHGISMKQVRRLCVFLKRNEQPIDHRGKSEGSRSNALPGDTLIKIQEHIESFPVKHMHYYNKDASSYYLDEKLNVKIMHTLYEQKYPDYPVKYKFYLKYFQENFSLSFGRKQIDVCGLCEELKIKLKNPHINENAKRVYQADIEIHKRQANKFYKKIQEVETKCKNDPNVYGIAFDFMQNLPLPHIPVQEIFYLRQLWLYEFCIYDLKTGKSVFYSYCEGVANKGPNEVCTFVLDYIKKYIGNDAKELHLFSDGCAGQNRNHAMVRVLLSLVAELGSNINEIQYYIPKRGHSFLPNDRMFGTAKRHIRKNDRIYTRTEYENLKAGANESFEIRRPKTEDIIDIKKWWPNHYKKLVLSVDSYGKGIPKDKKVTFGISKVSHFTFSKTTPGLVTTRESIDCLVSHDFQLLQRMGTKPSLPSSNTPAYAGKVPINEKKISDLKKIEKYIPYSIVEYQNFYTEVFAWPTTLTNNEYQEIKDD